MVDDDDHALSDFLRDRLPQVGLDYDTYGPYVLPLLQSEEADPEEWDSVVELLQASSESHSDDDSIWIQLRVDIQEEWKKYLQKIHNQKEEKNIQRAEELSKKLAEERRIAEQAAAASSLSSQDQTAATSNNNNNDNNKSQSDEAKKALLDRFGYEMDNEEGGDFDREGNPLTNQQIAAQAVHDKQQEMRSKAGLTSKKDEQAKTAKAKQDKAIQKEERRKRAAKVEKRRG